MNLKEDEDIVGTLKLNKEKLMKLLEGEDIIDSLKNIDQYERRAFYQHSFSIKLLTNSFVLYGSKIDYNGSSKEVVDNFIISRARTSSTTFAANSFA